MRPDGRKRQESFTGSGAVADKSTTSEKLRDYPGRELRAHSNSSSSSEAGNGSSQVAAYSTGPGHIFKFQEAEILARGDNRLLKFWLKTYFTFDGTIYEQVKGTPMGSPISGIIAEAVLQRLETLVFRHHRPKFWTRYVDDALVVIERDQVLTLKERLYNVFPDIQFTMEEEENNQLAFLDLLICHKDCDGLKTSVQESDEHDVNTELQQQPLNPPQTQLRKNAMSEC
ncbi:hypothetical protein SprV_0100471800 [Sparganum proliferum]